MSDLYNELLKKSIDREAKKIISAGATEQDRYGHLLDSVKGRNLEQEEIERKNAMISNVANSTKDMVEKRDLRADIRRNEVRNQRNIQEAESRDRINNIIGKYVPRAKATIDRERNKTYFG